MELPEDCKFIDYSILDVKKAVRKLAPYPPYVRDKVIEKLGKINEELSCHLREHFSD